MSTEPGLSNQTSVRTTFRILGPVLAVVGLVVCIGGFVAFAHYDGDDAPLQQMGMFMGGGVLFMVGMGMTRAGFVGAEARYLSGEVAPVARDGIDYLTRGRGVGSLGGTGTAGPFCRGCGTRNDDAAAFCDHCGVSLA